MKEYKEATERNARLRNPQRYRSERRVQANVARSESAIAGIKREISRCRPMSDRSDSVGLLPQRTRVSGPSSAVSPSSHGAFSSLT